MNRSRLVLCVVLSMALLIVGGMVASAGPQRDRGPVDSITGGGWFSPGPRPPVAGGQSYAPPLHKVHFNIRLICDPGEGNEHLRIHSTLGFDFEADDDTLSNNCTEFDDDDGMTDGESMGMCNGQKAMLNFSFADNMSLIDGDAPLVGGKGPVGDTAFFSMTVDNEDDVCNQTLGDELDGGNFNYHNGAAPPPTTAPPPAQ